MIRDENKIVLAGRHISGKPKIDVYTAAGYPIVSLTVRTATNVWESRAVAETKAASVGPTDTRIL